MKKLFSDLKIGDKFTISGFKSFPDGKLLSPTNYIKIRLIKDVDDFIFNVEVG